jgi:hypothetical protein
MQDLVRKLGVEEIRQRLVAARADLVRHPGHGVEPARLERPVLDREPPDQVSALLMIRYWKSSTGKLPDTPAEAFQEASDTMAMPRLVGAPAARATCATPTRRRESRRGTAQEHSSPMTSSFI